jgi:hypothetical protein
MKEIISKNLDVSSVHGDRQMTNASRLFIDFDGQQIAISTDVPAVSDLLERTYRSMLCRESISSAGQIEMRKTPRGYEIHGLEKANFEDLPVENVLDFLKRDVVRQFSVARPDLLWIHAAAVVRDTSALLIVGASAQGKSTLSTRLSEAGWRLMSDEVAPIRMDSDEVLPFPQAAFRRQYPGHELGSYEIGLISKEEVALPRASLHLEPAQISGVVFPLFKDGASPELETLSAGTAAMELFRNCLNFADHQAKAVARIAKLAESIPMYRLTYGDGKAGADAIQNGLK